MSIGELCRYLQLKFVTFKLAVSSSAGGSGIFNVQSGKYDLASQLTL